MAAKILIKRRFEKGNREEILQLLRELRSGAMNQPGYITGETLTSAGDPQTVLVIGTWENIESWYKWKENEARKKLEAMLAVYQETPTEYEEFLVGSFLQE